MDGVVVDLVPFGCVGDRYFQQSAAAVLIVVRLAHLVGAGAEVTVLCRYDQRIGIENRAERQQIIEGSAGLLHVADLILTGEGLLICEDLPGQTVLLLLGKVCRGDDILGQLGLFLRPADVIRIRRAAGAPYDMGVLTISSPVYLNTFFSVFPGCPFIVIDLCGDLVVQGNGFCGRACLPVVRLASFFGSLNDAENSVRTLQRYTGHQADSRIVISVAGHNLVAHDGAVGTPIRKNDGAALTAAGFAYHAIRLAVICDGEGPAPRVKFCDLHEIVLRGAELRVEIQDIVGVAIIVVDFFVFSFVPVRSGARAKGLCCCIERSFVGIHTEADLVNLVVG